MEETRSGKILGLRATLPNGISVGHWSDVQGRTGCTVVLASDGAVGGVEVRGGAPGTVGTDALNPGTLIEDGIARAVRPAHTMYDGDTIFCLANGTCDAPHDAVEAVAADVVARAIAAGVRAAQRVSAD